MRAIKVIIPVLCAVFGATAAHSQPADLVIKNANVHTVNNSRPTAQSVAVVGNKIVAVGSDADTKAYIGPKTRVIDAQGKVVIPGFNDAHVHFLETGAQLSSVDLRSAKTPQEFVDRIRAFASKLPKGRWILGGKVGPRELDAEQFTDSSIDRFGDARTTPVFIDRLDGHMALANSLADEIGRGEQGHG
jgi:predicted amidohydrolase YtcJ